MFWVGLQYFCFFSYAYDRGSPIVKPRKASETSCSLLSLQ